MMEDKWKPVTYNGISYAGLYDAHPDGSIRSNNYRRTQRSHILRPNYASRGYGKVWLSHNNEKERAIVSRIIAETFIPNPENKPYVDHIDTNKRNNCVENLRWVTPRENGNNETTIEHFRITNGGENARYLGKFGIEHNRSKPVFCESTQRFYGSTREAERETGVSRVMISLYCRGKIKQPNGLHWRWASASEISNSQGRE